MADAFLDYTISSNGYGDLYIPHVVQDVDLDEYFCRYMRGVNKPASTINLKSVFSRLPNYDGVSFGVIRGENTWDQVNTQEYVDAQNDFNAHVFWLWGSLKTGGCFCYKNSDGTRMSVGICYGWIVNTHPSDEVVTNYYYYQMKETFWMTYETCGNVAFTVSGLRDSTSVGQGKTLKQPIFNILAQGIDTPVSIRDMELERFDPLPISPPWGFARYPTQRNGSLIEAISNPHYSDAIFAYVNPAMNEAPERIWRPTYISRIDPWIQNRTIISSEGSWTGGKDINTGIDPYDTGDTSGPAGGGGDYPTQSDTTKPEDPNASGIDAIGTGFVELYNPTKAQVKAFNNYLFSESITEEISKMLKKLIADPLDYIVFIAMCHFTPNRSDVNEEITFCGLSTDIFARVVKPQFQQIDCGKIDLAEPTHSFMDYGGFAKAQIFIPYVGFRELPIDEIMGSRLGLVYNVDLLTGCFVAQVTVDRPTRPQFPRDATPGYNTIISQYEGNCYEFLPISSTDFRNIFSGMLSVASGVGSMLTGNAIGGLGSMASGVMSMKGNVNRSGQATSSYGYVGRQRAFLLLSRPFQSIPANFGAYEGYPSNMRMTIGACSGSSGNGYSDGYIETDPETVWGDNITYTYENTTITAFDDEMAEIKELFDKGVIVNV